AADPEEPAAVRDPHAGGTLRAGASPRNRELRGGRRDHHRGRPGGVSLRPHLRRRRGTQGGGPRTAPAPRLHTSPHRRRGDGPHDRPDGYGHGDREGRHGGLAPTARGLPEKAGRRLHRRPQGGLRDRPHHRRTHGRHRRGRSQDRRPPRRRAQLLRPRLRGLRRQAHARLELL
ncbi:MAG: hypothetical protein AVDCRST_MAG25-1065, partial [uncultured Rubrobacteraceae bacterium]